MKTSRPTLAVKKYSVSKLNNMGSTPNNQGKTSVRTSGWF